MDDTTLYLSDKDRFDKIEPILDEWCEASGAKFNIEKTEIILIGMEDHRYIIVATCKINPLDQSQLNNRIHITKDGEAVRSLGAWIGNNTNDLMPWEMMLDRIRKKVRTVEQNAPHALWQTTYSTGNCRGTHTIPGESSRHAKPHRICTI